MVWIAPPCTHLARGGRRGASTAEVPVIEHSQEACLSRHAETTARIKQVARAQIAEHGAASLSLGRIARSMGVSTPALYRYFDSRDALVHALVHDCYAELADEIEAAAGRTHDATLADRFRALLTTYREWGLRHDQDYVLIYGAVFPGCVVPEELVRPQVARTLRYFIELLEDARRAGCLSQPTAYRVLPDIVRRAVEPIAEAVGVEPSMVLLAYHTWLPAHALLWEQIRGTASVVDEADAFFELLLATLVERLGLTRC